MVDIRLVLRADDTDSDRNHRSGLTEQAHRRLTEAVMLAGFDIVEGPGRAYGTSGDVKLTDGVVEHHADEAEQGYDVTRLRRYVMHDHGPGTQRHAHSVAQQHSGDIDNPRANDHTGVATRTWEEDRADYRATTSADLQEG